MFIIFIIIIILLVFIFFEVKLSFTKNIKKDSSKTIEPIIVTLTKYDINVLRKINDSKILGIIILINNLEIEDLKNLIIEIKKIVKRKIIIALDEEREETYTSFYSKDFKVYPCYIGEKCSIDYARKIAILRASFLRDIGVNMLISPICNINFYMNKNIFSKDEDLSSKLIYHTVLSYKSKNMIVALKYFPKYFDDMLLKCMNIDNIKTFDAGIKANADFIMITNNFYNYYLDILVKKFNYKKLIITNYINNKKYLVDNAINIISEEIFMNYNYSIDTSSIDKKLEELINNI